MRVDVNYLHVRQGRLVYRRRVPEDLRPVIGKTEWTHGLGLPVGREREAAVAVAQYSAAYDQLIARERSAKTLLETPLMSANGLAVGPVDLPQEPARAVVETLARALTEACGRLMAQAQPMSAETGLVGQVPSATEETSLRVVTLSEAYAYDKATYGTGRNEKPFQEAVNSFVRASGDLDVQKISAKDVQGWIGECQAKRGQKPSSVQRRLNSLRAVVNRYYRDHEIDRRNPFRNAKISDAGGNNPDRLPFHRSHLKRIERYVATSATLRPETKDILALLQFTGARPLEIGGLDGDDVILDHDVPHIWIRHNAHRRLKTKGSERRIPLVVPALAAARTAKARAGAGALFSPTCHDTSALSQRLNKIIRQARVPKSTRLVAYSFRHTVEEALRSTGVPEHTQRRIMGHDDGSITGRYGAPAGLLDELKDALEKSIPKLGGVDKAIYAAEELCG